MNSKPRKTPLPPSDVVESIKPSRLYRRRDQDNSKKRTEALFMASNLVNFLDNFTARFAHYLQIYKLRFHSTVLTDCDTHPKA